MYNEENENNRKITRNEILEELNNMINSYQNLPPSAMVQPITHYDFVSLLLLISALFRAD